MHLSRVRALLAFVVFNSSALPAQVRLANPVRTAPVDLSAISQRAGTIFAGKVLRIEPIRVSSSNEVVSVQITCAADRGVRGTQDGQLFTFREWAGLWTARPRYRIGERLMLFLYAPSSVGLTSPVSGRLGQFAVDRDGRIVLSPWQQQAVRSAPKPASFDVKRPVPLRGSQGASH